MILSKNHLPLSCPFILFLQIILTFNIFPIYLLFKLNLLSIGLSYLHFIHSPYFYLNIDPSSCSIVNMLNTQCFTIIYRQPTGM